MNPNIERTLQILVHPRIKLCKLNMTFLIIIITNSQPFAGARFCRPRATGAQYFALITNKIV